MNVSGRKGRSLSDEIRGLGEHVRKVRPIFADCLCEAAQRERVRRGSVSRQRSQDVHRFDAAHARSPPS